jgi:hypothetical protein
MFDQIRSGPMMMTIDEIKEIDDELVLDVLDDSITKLTKTFKTCSYPRTMESLLMLMMNATFLKTGVFALCADDNPLSAAILYRSMIEHYLRHTCLFVRFVEEKNDAPGVEFYELADIKEHFEYFKSSAEQSMIFSKEIPNRDIEAMVYSKYPAYRQLGKSELRKKLSQFGIKSMVKFIWSKLSTVGLPPALYDNLLTDYSIQFGIRHRL